MRNASITLVLALCSLLAPAIADAATVITLAGMGDLQITTTGDLYFGTRDLQLSRIDLTVDDRLRTGLPAFAYPTTPDTRIDYGGLSGTNALSFADDVFIIDFVFQGTIDFRAASMSVAGDLASSGTINIGTTQVPPPTSCQDGSGVVVSGGSSSGTIQIGGCSPGVTITPPPVVIGPPPVTIAATPEPGAALLFGAGLFVLARRIRRRRCIEAVVDGQA